jgi:hypothetical protein
VYAVRGFDAGVVVAALEDAEHRPVVAQDFGLEPAHVPFAGVLHHPLVESGRQPGSLPLRVDHVGDLGEAGTQATGVYWVYLVAFTVVFFAGGWLVLERRCRQSTR